MGGGGLLEIGRPPGWEFRWAWEKPGAGRLGRINFDHFTNVTIARDRCSPHRDHSETTGLPWASRNVQDILWLPGCNVEFPGCLVALQKVHM